MAQIEISHERHVVEQHAAAIKKVEDKVIGNVAIGNSDTWQQFVEVTTCVDSIDPTINEVFEKYQTPWVAVPFRAMQRIVTERRAENDGEVEVYRHLENVSLPDRFTLSPDEVVRKRKEYSLLHNHGFYVPGFAHKLREVTAIDDYDEWRYFWEPDYDVINFYNANHPGDSTLPLELDHVLFVHEPALESRVDLIQRHFLSLAHGQGFSKSSLRLSAYFDASKHPNLPWQREPVGLNLEEIWVQVSGYGVDFQNNLPLHREITICTTDTSLPVMFDTDIETETPYGLPESVYHNEGTQPIATYEMVKFTDNEVFHETNNETTLNSARLRQILELAHTCLTKL